MKKKLLVVIAGPTASGKSSLALELAKHFQTEIISADSRQFYRHLNIGTAKPSKEELASVKHHAIDILEPDEYYSAGKYEEDVLQTLKEIFSNKNMAILVGGSGLYIKAVCQGFDEMPEIDLSIRNALNKQLKEEGLAPLHEKLKALDPKSFQSIDLQNPQRVVRALEVSISCGKPFSTFKKDTSVDRPFAVCKIALDVERDKLYERINKRVDEMMSAGLLEEVRSLLPYKDQNALKTVGYREFIPYFEGKKTVEQAVDSVKQATRNYAKRQLTWLRKEKDIHWFKPSEVPRIMDYIKDQIKGLC